MNMYENQYRGGNIIGNIIKFEMLMIVMCSIILGNIKRKKFKLKFDKMLFFFLN